MSFCCAVNDCSNGSYRLKKWKDSHVCGTSSGLHPNRKCACEPPFKLFPFPTEKRNKKLREQWILLINRSAVKKGAKSMSLWSPSKDSRVCSDHFVDGKPTPENYLPTLQLGYKDADKKVQRILRFTSTNPDEMSPKRRRLSQPAKATVAPDPLVALPYTPVTLPYTPVALPDTPAALPDTPVALPHTPVDLPETPVDRADDNQCQTGNMEKMYSNDSHGNQMLSHMSQLWKEKKFCDAYVEVGDVKIQVHKLILVATSPQLLAFAYGSSATAMLSVTLPSSMDIASVYAFLSYLYDGDLHLTLENLSSVEKIASIFQISDVLKYCNHFRELTKSISTKFQSSALAESLPDIICTTTSPGVESVPRLSYADVVRESAPNLPCTDVVCQPPDKTQQMATSDSSAAKVITVNTQAPGLTTKYTRSLLNPGVTLQSQPITDTPAKSLQTQVAKPRATEIFNSVKHPGTTMSPSQSAVTVDHLIPIKPNQQILLQPVPGSGRNAAVFLSIPSKFLDNTSLDVANQGVLPSALTYVSPSKTRTINRISSIINQGPSLLAPVTSHTESTITNARTGHSMTVILNTNQNPSCPVLSAPGSPVVETDRENNVLRINKEQNKCVVEKNIDRFLPEPEFPVNNIPNPLGVNLEVREQKSSIRTQMLMPAFIIPSKQKVLPTSINNTVKENLKKMIQQKVVERNAQTVLSEDCISRISTPAMEDPDRDLDHRYSMMTWKSFANPRNLATQIVDETSKWNTEIQSAASKIEYEGQMKFPQKRREYVCQICSNTFVKSTAIAYHLRTDHQEEIQNIPDKVEITLRGKQSRTCNTCGFQLSEKSARRNLSYHMYFKHGTPLPSCYRVFKCNQCTHEFTSKLNCETHIQVSHQSDRPIMCELCGDTFKTKNYLRSHNYNCHSKKRRFRCTYCKKAFKQHVDVKYHMRIHQGYRPFTCPRCDYKSCTKGNLKAHLARKHDLNIEDLNLQYKVTDKWSDYPVETLSGVEALVEESDESEAETGKNRVGNRKRRRKVRELEI